MKGRNMSFRRVSLPSHVAYIVLYPLMEVSGRKSLWWSTLMLAFPVFHGGLS